MSRVAWRTETAPGWAKPRAPRDLKECGVGILRVIWNQGPTDGRPLCWNQCGDESAVDRCITAIHTGGLVAGLGLALSKPLNQRAAFLNLVVGWNFEERAGLFAAIDPCEAIAGLTHPRVAVLRHHHNLQLR